MDATSRPIWPPQLTDPGACRMSKPRTCGKTMVMDKGLGVRAFEDLLETSAPYIDVVKLGFGTPALYPVELLERKTELARRHQVAIMPGGTFLEVAVVQGTVPDYFRTIRGLGFTAVEVSDGTIDLARPLRSELIVRGLEAGLLVFTEYGKKAWGSAIDSAMLLETVNADIGIGAELVTVEARESGEGVGLFDEDGVCRDEQLRHIAGLVPDMSKLLWEAPQKQQQVHLLKALGPGVNLGNIAPQDIYSLEALRRGLRSDTFRNASPKD